MDKMIKVCPKCGAVYELTERHVTMRDKDSLYCDDCQTEIHTWNGGCIWYKQRISQRSINNVGVSE